MSQCGFGINMYGVSANNISTKDVTPLNEIAEYYEWSVEVAIGNRKIVPLAFMSCDEYEDIYLGYLATYPWDVCGTMEEHLTPEDIEKAIVKILKPGGYDPELIKKDISEINAPGYC